jgi:hypothetical protein
VAAKAQTPPILREACGQYHDRCCADHGADHPEPSLAQRSPELRLTDGRRGGTGPKGVVEFEPERDEESETDGSPQPNAEEERFAGSGQRIRQVLAEWN